jgi:SAM-dependent methyltransferase
MKKLHLCSGTNYMNGFINLDIDETLKSDICFDLNYFPYPFEDDYFDYVYSAHGLEHLNDINKVMKEINRICKHNAKIVLILPHFSSGNSYRDLTHKYRGLSLFAFDDLNGFIVKKREINWLGTQNSTGIKENIYYFLIPLNWIFSFFINLCPKIYERFFCWIFPSYEIKLELKVVKNG